MGVCLSNSTGQSKYDSQGVPERLTSSEVKKQEQIKLTKRVQVGKQLTNIICSEETGDLPSELLDKVIIIQRFYRRLKHRNMFQKVVRVKSLRSQEKEITFFESTSPNLTKQGISSGQLSDYKSTSSPLKPRKMFTFQSQEAYRPKGTHVPDPTVATKMNQTPMDYPYKIQQIIIRLGPFRYNDFIKKPQSQFYTPNDDDKILPFLEPYLYENGNIYIGQWKQGLRHGKGKLIWPNGTIYEGFWKKDEPCGIGRIIYLNGDYYLGDWNIKQNGKGSYTHDDGSFYKGEWLNGQQHGLGEEILKDKTSFKGQYEDGFKQGWGVYVWPDNNTYEGNLKKNMFEGYGIYKWSDGKIYKGQWKENKKHGQGLFIWPDGRKYDGEVLNINLLYDQVCYGEFTFSDLKIYKGYWLDGKMHGNGQMSDENGVIRKGIWLCGKLQKWKD